MADQDTVPNQLAYRDRMLLFVADEEFRSLDDKYDPYLSLHNHDSVTEFFDILQNTPGEKVTGKLFWKTRFDPPPDIKKDIIRLFDRHFAD